MILNKYAETEPAIKEMVHTYINSYQIKGARKI
jgi:hypothetical protein